MEILTLLYYITLSSSRENQRSAQEVVVARFLFVCVGAWDSSVISYWIDTLVLKN